MVKGAGFQCGFKAVSVVLGKSLTGLPPGLLGFLTCYFLNVSWNLSRVLVN